MLPDFPTSKSEINKQLMLRLRLKTQEFSPLASSMGSSVTQHEGTLHTYSQEGFGNVTEDFERLEVPIQIPTADFESLVGERLLKRIDDLAEATARQVSQLGFRKLDEVTRKTGMVSDAQGKPLDQEMYLQMLERVQMTFDDSGRPTSTLVMHPDMAKAFVKEWESWQKDQAFMKRYKDLIQQKKEEWRDRESNRKLVD